MNEVLIRVDSGAEAGLGHLRRCLALAAALVERGLDPQLLVPRDEVAVAKARGLGVAAAELDVAPGSDDDLAAVRERAADVRALVVDSYAWHPDALAAANELAPTVAVADLGGAFDCSLVVDGGPDAEPPKYTGSRAELLLGPRFALLSRDLWELERPAPPPEPSVLLTFGGASGRELAQLAAAVEEAAVARVVVVAGPYADPAEIRAIVPGADVVVAPPTLTPLFQTSSVVVTAGGQTLLEVLRIGVPAVVVEIASNQAPGIAAAAARGAVVDAGSFGDDAPARVAHAVATLLADPGERERLSAAGRGWVVGLGAGGVAERIESL